MKNFLLTLITGCLFLASNISYSQCTISHAGGSMGLVPGDWGQGFATTCSGTISHINVTSFNTGIVPAGTLKIYTGNTTSGTPIYQQSFNDINVANNGDFVTIDITGNVPVLNGNQYTFEFNPGPIILRGSSDYLGGDAFLDGVITNNTDIDFEVVIIAPLTINDLSLSSINISPNPTTGQLTIKFDDAVLGQLLITNTIGQVILTDEINGSIHKIQLDGPSGVYFLQIKADKKTLVKMIVKH